MTKEVNGSNLEANQTAQEQAFAIQKIYTKDISFESPNALEAFALTQWNPHIHLDIETCTQLVDKDLHEVMIALTVTANLEDKKAAFLVEVKQSGLFHLAGFPKEQLKHMLGSFCPNILFPYGRQVISELVNQGGFPPLYLAPVNFDALYQQHLQEEQSHQGTTE